MSAHSDPQVEFRKTENSVRRMICTDSRRQSLSVPFRNERTGGRRLPRGRTAEAGGYRGSPRLDRTVPKVGVWLRSVLTGQHQERRVHELGESPARPGQDACHAELSGSGSPRYRVDQDGIPCWRSTEGSRAADEVTIGALWRDLGLWAAPSFKLRSIPETIIR